MSALVQRYARATVDVALQHAGADVQAALGPVVAGLSTFSQLYRHSSALQEMLRNPIFKPQRRRVLSVLLAQASIDGVAARLILALADNGRTALVDKVARTIEAISDSRAGRLRATVQSAGPMTAAQQAALTASLTQRLGAQVVLRVFVVPELLGGCVCRVGDLTFDTSLKRQLETLTERLGA